MRKLPNCLKCSGKAVVADAGLLKSIPYFYCRTCQTEIDDWGFRVDTKELTEEELEKEILDAIDNKMTEEDEELDDLNWTWGADPSVYY